MLPACDSSICGCYAKKAIVGARFQCSWEKGCWVPIRVNIYNRYWRLGVVKETSNVTFGRVAGLSL